MANRTFIFAALAVSAIAPAYLALLPSVIHAAPAQPPGQFAGFGDTVAPSGIAFIYKRSTSTPLAATLSTVPTYSVSADTFVEKPIARASIRKNFQGMFTLSSM